MSKRKNKESLKPINPEMSQMDDEKLMEYIKSLNFETPEAMNEFFKNNVVGKRIQDILPKKAGSKTKKEKSDDLMYQAYESDLKEGIKLAKEALQLNPKNVRALNYLGDLNENPEIAMQYYLEAIEAGAKQLGEKFFIENKGHFWGLVETRPYMTARFNYAYVLYNTDNFDEAIKEFIEIINLNPRDNQGVRHILSGLLLICKKYKTYYKLYKKYHTDNSATWLFNNALYLFITEGQSENANMALAAAHKSNKFIISGIINPLYMKKEMSRFTSAGDKDEAIYYLLYNLGAWNMNKKAIEWLEDFSAKNLKNNKMKLIIPDKD